MKYNFSIEDDIVTLKYKDKSFTFKSNVNELSKLQSLIMEARVRLIEDLAERGKSVKGLTIEYKKDGKTYYDNSNKKELENIYREKITLEYYDNKCKELFNMDLSELMQDIGINGEEESTKFSSDFFSYLSGKTPRKQNNSKA